MPVAGIPDSEFAQRVQRVQEAMKEEGLDVTREVTMAKLLAGPLVRKVADGCLQMFGGMGFMNETYVSQYYRDVRILSIGGGADEVMSDVIAKLEGY